MKMSSEVPVTGLSTRDYAGIFGAEPIASDEVIIDIGSGESRLGSLVPDGEMIQIDPIYNSTLDNTDITFVGLRLGKPEITKTPAYRHLVNSEASRVTTAHLLHHLTGERKVQVVEQILHLARFGIAQFYPVKSRNPAELATAAEKRGVEISITRPPVRNVSRLMFAATGINHTLNVLSQPDRMTPRDRSKLAELILPAIV